MERTYKITRRQLNSLVKESVLNSIKLLKEDGVSFRNYMDGQTSNPNANVGKNGKNAASVYFNPNNGVLRNISDIIDNDGQTRRVMEILNKTDITDIKPETKKKVVTLCKYYNDIWNNFNAGNFGNDEQFIIPFVRMYLAVVGSSIGASIRNSKQYKQARDNFRSQNPVSEGIDMDEAYKFNYLGTTTDNVEWADNLVKQTNYIAQNGLLGDVGLQSTQYFIELLKYEEVIAGAENPQEKKNTLDRMKQRAQEGMMFIKKNAMRLLIPIMMASSLMNGCGSGNVGQQSNNNAMMNRNNIETITGNFANGSSKLDAKSLQDLSQIEAGDFVTVYVTNNLNAHRGGLSAQERLDQERVKEIEDKAEAAGAYVNIVTAGPQIRNGVFGQDANFSVRVFKGNGQFNPNQLQQVNNN